MIELKNDYEGKFAMAMNERPIPPAALNDENSVEMFRVWIAQNKLHCSIKIGMYSENNIDEEDAWGTILADCARHITMALSREFGANQEVSIQKIRAKFNAELAEPTSEATGEFVPPKNPSTIQR